MDKALSKPTKVIQEYQLLGLAKWALVIGVALIALYAIALWQLPAAHEAFHDLRHAAGFPCH